MKWIKEKRKNKSIYNMTKLELIANLKEKQKIIDEAMEYFKYHLDNLDFYKEPKAKMLCTMGIILLQEGDKENESN